MISESPTSGRAGRREVPGSITGCACRPCRSEFSVVFSETRVDTGWDPLERPLPTDGILSVGLGSICEQLTLKPTTLFYFGKGQYFFLTKFLHLAF